jgi:hypothetical protein
MALAVRFSCFHVTLDTVTFFLEMKNCTKLQNSLKGNAPTKDQNGQV